LLPGIRRVGQRSAMRLDLQDGHAANCMTEL